MADVGVAPIAQDLVDPQKLARIQQYIESDAADELRAKLQKMAQDAGERRLVADIDDIREYDAQLAHSVLNEPREYVAAFNRALRDQVQHINPSALKDPRASFQIGFTGTFGRNHVTPRTLSSTMINKLVCIDGIVTKCSLVRPKVVKSVHYCEATSRTSEKEYRDATALVGKPTSSVYPTKDDADNLLSTEYGLCIYKDNQVVHLQEMPESSEVGQLPRSVDVILDHDLVDSAKPGDRVRITGIFLAMPGGISGHTNGLFKTAIYGVGMQLKSKSPIHLTPTVQDIQHIREVSKRPDIVNLLSRSIAPSIHGRDEIKKGMLLMLLGGRERNLPNGTHLRGDINVLMIGDPSTAKSQMLRAVMNVAPLAISTSGRGSSGVGLTAAVTSDRDTGEKRLEAGAMVLADRGVVCIDEFDKMSDADRVAIHEVMEQQTVTIAKAGIHTSLNARSSVVAAANPVYGSYDDSRRATENIGLPDSILSRFDLLFVVLDKSDAAKDRAISDHVLRVHRYQEGGDVGASLNRMEENDFEDDEAAKEEDTPVFQQFNRFLHDEQQEGMLTTGFLRKYINYAKSRVKPELQMEAREAIANAYAELREPAQGSRETSLPVTPRMLETIIRLSIAYAKARLSPFVDESDVESAVELVKFCLLGVESQEALQRRREADAQDNTDSSDDDSEDDDMGAGAISARRKRTPASKRPTPGSPQKKARKDSLDFEDEEAKESSRRRPRQAGAAASKAASSPKAQEKAGPSKTASVKEQDEVIAIDNDRMDDFRARLSALFDQGDGDGLEFEYIVTQLSQGSSNQRFSRREINAYLAEMQMQNDLYGYEDEGVQKVAKMG